MELPKDPHVPSIPDDGGHVGKHCEFAKVPRHETGRTPEEEVNRIRALRVSASRMLSNYVKDNSLPSYIEKKRIEAGQPQASVGIEMLYETDSHTMALWDIQNDIVGVNSEGDIVLGGTLQCPELPPGKLYAVGFVDKTGISSRADAFVTSDGSEVVFTYGGFTARLERLHDGLVATSKILHKATK